VEKKLVPAHIHFTRWFIRIRWIAVIILIISNYIVSHLFNISVQEKSIYILAIILLLLNILHHILLNLITKKEITKVVTRIKKEIQFQIITDLLILTFIIHYSGGIENPLILFYFFHLIIASSIFSRFQSHLYVAYVLLLTALLALLECYSLIPHHQLEGFVNHDLFKNPVFIFGNGVVFACASFFVVNLSHMIIHRSIKSEEKHVKTNIELENKDKMKNEYVFQVTHDIKGHVAAILSCIEVIQSKMAGPLNSEQEDFANRAFKRTELLSIFINDLLNLTKKRLKHDTEFEEFILKDLINKVVTHIQVLLKEKSIDFNIYIDPSVQIIKANPFTIEELYSNLLLNAVKYTPPHGHIELTVRDRLDHIITEISDSGIGIPDEELTKVFDEFYRATNVPKNIKTGSGLGLSIVKQIIENHKGKIWVNSELGAWTKFTFILPKNPDFPFKSA
jgi:signal transduction histidine kinase